MLIKVARLGNAVSELALADGLKVSDALQAAGLVVENEDIRVNSNTASVTTVLNNGDIVTLVPKVKGGQKIVKVARLGSAVQQVAVADDATVEDAIEAVGLDIDNEDVRIDGRTSDLESPIGDGQLITIVPKVKGGK